MDVPAVAQHVPFAGVRAFQMDLAARLYVDAAALEKVREAEGAELADEPLRTWTVTVEYRAHQFFGDEPCYHTVEGISALDAEQAEAIACAEVRALDGVTVSEIIRATVVRDEDMETAAKVIDLMGALKDSLNGGAA